MQVKNSVSVVPWILVALLAICGCANMRFAASLQPDPGDRGLQVGDGVKFALTDVRTTGGEEIPSDLYPGKFTVTELNARASEVYPALFGADFTALPVSVSMDCTFSSINMLPFGIGLIPLPATETVECAVRTRVADVDGYAVDNSCSLTLTSALWGTLFTPLGLIPVPGTSNVRSNILSDSQEYVKRTDRVMMDSLIEAVARNITRADRIKLQAAARSRRERLEEQTVHGTVYWTYLWFGRTDPRSEGVYDIAVATVFREKPTLSAKPLSQAAVAALKDGRWQPVPAYLQGITPLTAARVITTANGRPAGVRLDEVIEPPLEDFIDLPAACTPDFIRWSNSVLVDAKNTSLRKLVRQGSPDVLARLVTRIEKAVLDLNERAQMADGKAEQLTVEGKDAKQETETAVLCRQRTAIFQAVLPSLRQAAAGD